MAQDKKKKARREERCGGVGVHVCTCVGVGACGCVWGVVNVLGRSNRSAGEKELSKERDLVE